MITTKTSATGITHTFKIIRKNGFWKVTTNHCSIFFDAMKEVNFFFEAFENGSCEIDFNHTKSEIGIVRA